MKKPVLPFILIIPFLFSMALANDMVKNLSPQPRQAYIREAFSAIFCFSKYVKIYLDEDVPDYKAARKLNDNLIARGIDTLVVELLPKGGQPGGGIYISRDTARLNSLARNMPGEPLVFNDSFPGREGYVIDIIPSMAYLGAAGHAGLDYAVTTLFQLYDNSGMEGCIFSCRIVDAPQFPERWFFYPVNIQVPANTTKAKSIWKDAVKYKLNGVNLGDYKFSFISDRPDTYYDSLKSLVSWANVMGLNIIPGVMPIGYSNSILYHDPNLAEGLPVKNQKFYIEGDTGRLVPKVNVSLTNGGFEVHNGDNFPGFLYIDKPGQMSIADNEIKHSGNISIRFSDFKEFDPDNGNARICYRTMTEPYTYYHLSGWVKTEGLKVRDELRMTAIGNNGKTLAYNSLNIPSTTDGWMKVDLCFNTLESDTIAVYWGAWGAYEGTFWWDDISLEETAFVNLLRRPGAPVNVSHPILDIAYIEGVDYDTLRDPKLGLKNSWYGDYLLYTNPPPFRIKPGGNIHNGDTILISYYHTVTIYDGQAMVCVSEPALYDILDKEFRILDSLIKPENYFMNHDEIRLMNHDYSCLSRDLTPAEILADNTNRCFDIIKKYNPKAKIWDWSDMFDEYHNAGDNYYLVNGSLKGSADLIIKNIGIVNWNSQAGKSKNSLAFFEGKGFQQMSAPYYDAGIDQIRKWKERTAKTQNFLGMMYTTWQGDYSNLEPFAEYAWNHAPYIYHYAPAREARAGGTIHVTYMIYGDKYDSGWLPEGAKIFFRTSPEDDFDSLDIGFEADKNLTFELNLPDDNKWLQYYLTANDNRGLTTKVPYGEGRYYEIGERPAGIYRSEDKNIFTIIYSSEGGGIYFHTDMTAPVDDIRIIDIFGRTVKEFTNNDIYPDTYWDFSDDAGCKLIPGVYYALARYRGRYIAVKFITGR